MASLQYDFHFFKAGLDELETYLLSDELYYPISTSAPPGEREYPRLTLGALLLTQIRLHARRLAPPQAAEFSRLQGELERIRARWRVNWGRKAERSYSARLQLWRDFLEEYREDPASNAGRFAYEVRLRAMLHLLEPEFNQSLPAKIELLAGLDQVLRAVIVPGEFIWESELRQGFNSSSWWYLFGHLPEKLHR